MFTFNNLAEGMVGPSPLSLPWEAFATSPWAGIGAGAAGPVLGSAAYGYLGSISNYRDLLPRGALIDQQT